MNAFFEGAFTLCNCLKWMFIHNYWLIKPLLIKTFNTSKNVCGFDKSRIIVKWLQSSYVCDQRHMLRMIATPREILCFPRQGLGGKHLVTNWMAWCSVSHASIAQWGVGNKSYPNWLCWKNVESKNWMLRQSVRK